MTLSGFYPTTTNGPIARWFRSRMTSAVALNLAGAILIVVALAVVLRVAHHVATGRLVAESEEPEAVLAQAIERRAA